MKFVSTILAGALSVCAVVAGCSSDEENPAAGGTSGCGSGATGCAGASGRGGATGSGGSSGSSGSSGSGGSSGSASDARADVDAGQCNDDNPSEITECKRRGNEEGVCSSLVNCSCDKCACMLAECQARPACLALRQCALAKRCCSPSLVACQPDGCCTGDLCEIACSTELTAAAADTFDGGTSLSLALNLDSCVYTTHDRGAACNTCPAPDAGDSGRSDARDSGGG
jgi:hypothetical protein